MVTKKKIFHVTSICVLLRNIAKSAVNKEKRNYLTKKQNEKRNLDLSLHVIVQQQLYVSQHHDYEQELQEGNSGVFMGFLETS